jgi:hypothetical protein
MTAEFRVFANAFSPTSLRPHLSLIFPAAKLRATALVTTGNRMSACGRAVALGEVTAGDLETLEVQVDLSGRELVLSRGTG